MSSSAIALRLFAPQLIVGMTGVLVLVADLIWLRPADRPSGRPPLAYLGVAGLLVAAASLLLRPTGQTTVLGGTFVFDALSVYLDLLFIGIAIAAILLAIEPLPTFSPWAAEYYVLIIWCTLGSMLIAPAAELFTLFLCLQLTSLPVIVLVGYGKNDRHSSEAALKYLLIVLVSTALFLYGLSLVYGVFGTSSMSRIGAALSREALQPLAAVGLILMLAGFGFKAAAAPFQYWVPDVYQGAPSPTTAFLSVGSKLTGFVLVLRFVMTSLVSVPDLHLVFAVLAVCSMFIGNLGALQQTNIKRLLGYSGVAQAGYILVGLAALNVTGISALLFYLAAYALANLLAFGVIISFSQAVGSEEITDYAGLGRRSPLAAAGLAAALLSLAGLPLTAGFMAKFYVFLSAAEAGMLWLVLIAVANTVLAFYYYLRIVWTLFVTESEADHIVVSRLHTAIVGVGVLGIVALGMFPGPLLAAVTVAAKTLFPS